MSVKTAEELHAKAMAFVDEALISELEGHDAEAQKLRVLAFEHELQAADAIAADLTLEPTRSVLHRSAASLGIECGKVPAAEKLIYRALAGNPPAALAEELKDLLETVGFRRHLELRGVELQDDEVQMSLAGHAVGFGIAPTDEFISRVASTEKLLFRLAERRLGKPYRERGQTASGLRSDLQLFVSVPRAASFAVTFKIGRGEQLKLPGMDFGRMIVDEFLEELELFNAADQAKLRERIPSEAYFRNFTALARTIAPDSDSVMGVGFTAVRGGVKKDVSLLKPANTLFVVRTDLVTNAADKVQVLTGRLKRADAIHEGKNKITLVPEHGGSPKNITVPEGMMSDIVRPMWDELVKVSARLKRGGLELVDVQRLRSTKPGKNPSHS